MASDFVSLSQYIDENGEFNAASDRAYNELTKKLTERKNTYLRRLINSTPESKLRSTYLLPDNEDYDSALNKLLACNALLKQLETWRYPLQGSPFSEPEETTEKGPPSSYREYLNRLNGLPDDTKRDIPDDITSTKFFTLPSDIEETKPPAPYALNMIPTNLRQLSEKQIKALQEGKLSELFSHPFIQAFISRDSLGKLLATNKVGFFSKIFRNKITSSTDNSTLEKDVTSYLEKSGALNKAGKTKISQLIAEILTLRTAASQNLMKTLAITLKLGANNYFFALGKYIPPQQYPHDRITTDFSPFRDFLSHDLADYADKQQQQDFAELNELLTQLLIDGTAHYSSGPLEEIYNDSLVQELLIKQCQRLYFSDQGKLNSYGKALGEKLKHALETTCNLRSQQDLLARQRLIDLFSNGHNISRQSAIDSDHYIGFVLNITEEEQQPTMQEQPDDARLKHFYKHPFIQLVIQQRGNQQTDAYENESMQSMSPTPSQTSSAST